jgi:hypothetical protein
VRYTHKDDSSGKEEVYIYIQKERVKALAVLENSIKCTALSGQSKTQTPAQLTSSET